MKISDKIRLIREALHFKKYEFAHELQISAAYVSDLESGKKVPGGPLLELIMLKFNISTDWWEVGEGPMFASRSVKNCMDDLLAHFPEEARDSLRKRIVLAIEGEQRLLLERIN